MPHAIWIYNSRPLESGISVLSADSWAGGPSNVSYSTGRQGNNTKRQDVKILYYSPDS